MFGALAKFIFYKVIKWKMVGSFPADIPKYIVIVAPHTSNWDFLIGVIARSFLPKKAKKAKYLGKKELFKPPLGWIFRALGGYPVDRSKHTNLVDAIAAIFDSKKEFIIALAPEGTRKHVGKFKTGFYYIAKKAKVPIVLVAFNYGSKTISISEPFYTGTEFEQDMSFILSHYKGIKGKNPEFGLA